MSEVQNCCEGDSPKTRPKGTRRRRSTVQLFHLTNPIPGEIADSGELKKVFSKFGLVPYAGSTLDSGHSLLVWYLALARLSNTHGTCINKLNLYAFGGNLRAEYSAIQEFDTGEERKPVPTPLAQQYRDVIFSTINFEGGAQYFHKTLGWCLKVSGNAWVEMRVATVNGQTSVTLRCQKLMRVLYNNTDPGEMRTVSISPVWTEEYLTRKPPRVVPVSEPGQPPVMKRQPDGVLSTMYHLKAGQYDWYGRPDSDYADLPKMQEAQHAMYLIKQADANFIPGLIIEVEDEEQQKNPVFDNDSAQEKGFDDWADRFEMNYTMKSDDPQSAMIVARPYGSRPMAVFQIKPNTNENWFAVTGKDAAERIMRGHNCTLRFLGFEASNGFSADTFVADYVFNMEPVINAHRRDVTHFVNKIIGTIWYLLGLQQWDELSLTFSSPIAAAVDDYKKQRTNNEQNNNNGPGSGQVQPGRT